MKKLIFITLILSLLASCLPESEKSSTSSTSGTGTTTGGTTTTTTGGTTGSGTTGGTTSNGFPVHSFNIFLAGGQSWFPQSNTAPLADTFINLQEAAIAFQTDGLLRVRLKIKPQEIPPTNQTHCFGRTTGAGFAPYYSKLKFDLSLRDITCSGGGTTCSASDYILGAPYRRSLGLGPIDTNSFSEVIDIGANANLNVVATAVEISNVRSDQFCAANGSFCPAEKSIRTKDCFSMELQVQTSFTQTF